MKRKPKYLVVIEREGPSFGAYVPDLPGCVAVAKSLPAVRRLIREAIDLHLEDLVAQGQRPPKALTAGEYMQPSLA